MDEEISIINTKTRNEKIKNFFLENKKKLILTFIFIILTLVSYYSYEIYKDNYKKKISDRYNNAVINYENVGEASTVLSMKEIIQDKDSTYSPLALYFIIDNDLIQDKNEVNNLFDIVIDKASLETEIKNLNIFKKALYNADTINEEELLDILNPLVNSKSIWKSHALYLAAEYFYSKKEMQKAKEFFTEIISVENVNKDILIEAQKRLNRDLSD